MDQLPLSAHLRSLANPVGGPLSDGNIADRQRTEETAAGAKPFSDTLREQIEEVNSLQIQADESIEDLVTGKSDNVHETMIALQKADVSFRLLMTVRNKLVDAYDEVMRMQI